MSTSLLQSQVGNLLSLYLSEHEIKENVRPDWLITEQGARLELDFYLEKLNFAMEVQGKQHYIYVPYFHGDYANFLRQLKHDEFKRDCCDERGVQLIAVSNYEEAKQAILNLMIKVRAKRNSPKLEDIRTAVECGLGHITIGNARRGSKRRISKRRMQNAVTALKNTIRKMELQGKGLTDKRSQTFANSLRAIAAYRQHDRNYRFTLDEYAIIYGGLVILGLDVYTFGSYAFLSEELDTYVSR